MVIRLLCDLKWVRRVPSRDSARPVVFRCLYTYSGSLVWWRAPAERGEWVKLARLFTTIRHRTSLSTITYIYDTNVVLYMQPPMTPPPEWCPFGSASAHQSARLPLLPLAQPPCAPHTLEASCWARASTAVGAASMRTSHPRSVVLGCANSAVLSTTRSTHSERVRMHH